MTGLRRWTRPTWHEGATIMIRVIQHVKAPNDVNGNPRRLFLVTEIAPEYVDSDNRTCSRVVKTTARDEGYRGMTGAIRDHKETDYFLPSVHTTPSEYKRLLRQFPE